ncbi:Os09g0283801, partial [Oryza sativa Japonica Group]
RRKNQVKTKVDPSRFFHGRRRAFVGSNQPYGNNEDDGGGVVRISDEVDAAEIQLQEVIMSSAMAATAAAAAAQR